MAKPEDSEIERILRRVVKDAVRKEEDVTIKLARSRVETELALEEGFFKNDQEWKVRSKNIIEAAFQEDDEPEEVVTKSPAKIISTPKPVQKSPVKSILKPPAIEKSPAKSTTKPKPIEKPQSAQTFKKTTPQQRAERVNASLMKPITAPSRIAAPVPKTNATPREESEHDESSESDDSDESEDSEEDSSGSVANQSQTLVLPEPKRPEQTAPKVNGVKRKADDESVVDATDSGSEEEEEEEVVEEDQHKDKRAKTKYSAGDGETSHTEEDGSEEGSEDGSEVNSEDSADDGSNEGSAKESNEKGVEEEVEERQQAESEVQTKDTQTQEAAEEEPEETTLQAIPPKHFQPPPGYTLLDSDRLETNAIFSSANLAGKQIWHITAPSTLPLSSIRELSLNSIQSGNSSLTQNNIDYTIASSQSQNSTTRPNLALLLPTKEGYETTSQPITHTLQIQQKITLPNLTMRQASQATGSAAAADIARPATNSIRPQPKGLRMRYKPPGFGPGKPGTIGSGSDSMEEDDEDGDKRQKERPKATFQFPKALGAFGRSVEEIAGAAVTSADVEAASALKKTTNKKKKEKRKDRESVEGTQGSDNGVSAFPEARVPAPLKTAAVAADSSLPNGVAAAPERFSKEEKAKRKEEKRLKKERREEAKRKAAENTS